MARKPRIHYPGAVYHVILRGDAGDPIFLDDQDHFRRYLFLQYASKDNFAIHEGDKPGAAALWGHPHDYREPTTKGRMTEMKKLTAVCFVISLGLLAGNAVADETYICTQGDQERIITIVYQDQAAKVPCEVRYQKGDVIETLWNAQNEVGYCEEKAAAFLEKQRGWGWDCAMAGEAMAEEGMMEQGTMEEGTMEEGTMEEGTMEEGTMEEGAPEGMQEEMQEGMQEESK